MALPVIFQNGYHQRNMTDIQERTQGDFTIIELAGKLDASTTPKVQDSLVSLIQGGKKYLVLDFGAVTYLASSGLRMLLLVGRKIKEKEGRLVLCRLDQTMKNTLDLTGFLPNFKIVSTLDEALQFLAS